MHKFFLCKCLTFEALKNFLLNLAISKHRTEGPDFDYFMFLFS